MPLIKIISGGQTGSDRAALDIALELKIPCGGWCPKGRKAEDGVIDSMYPLQETPSENYSQRTEWNVRDADGVLIFCYEKPTGGPRESHKPGVIYMRSKAILRNILADYFFAIRAKKASAPF